MARSVASTIGCIVLFASLTACSRSSSTPVDPSTSEIQNSNSPAVTAGLAQQDSPVAGESPPQEADEINHPVIEIRPSTKLQAETAVSDLISAWWFDSQIGTYSELVSATEDLVADPLSAEWIAEGEAKLPVTPDSTRILKIDAVLEDEIGAVVEVVLLINSSERQIWFDVNEAGSVTKIRTS